MNVSNISFGNTTMREFEAKLSAKGQITLPQEIRRILDLHPGDRVCFEVVGEVVKIRRASSKITQSFGAVTPRNKPEDFQALREEFEVGVGLDCVKESS